MLQDDTCLSQFTVTHNDCLCRSLCWIIHGHGRYTGVQFLLLLLVISTACNVTQRYAVRYGNYWVELTCMRDVCDPINEFNQRTKGNVRHCLLLQDRHLDIQLLLSVPCIYMQGM